MVMIGLSYRLYQSLPLPLSEFMISHLLSSEPKFCFDKLREKNPCMCEREYLPHNKHHSSCIAESSFPVTVTATGNKDCATSGLRPKKQSASRADSTWNQHCCKGTPLVDSSFSTCAAHEGCAANRSWGSNVVETLWRAEPIGPDSE